MDRFFLSKQIQSSGVPLTAKNLTLYQLTCVLLAAKYDELDENIPLIRDLQRHYGRLLTGAGASDHTPTFEEVIECERNLMRFFNWNLMFVTPTHFVKTLLANGVVFEND